MPCVQIDIFPTTDLHKQGRAHVRIFWWGNEMEISGQKHRCISARGAGGQFIFILPTLDLIAVVTSHNKEKAMRYPFDLLKGVVLPAFASE